MFFLDTFLKGLKPQYDDDIVDRVNYYYTPMILIIFALTMSAKQYVGQPIQCWVPAQFTGAWEQYSENYCFVQNTYFLPLDQYIPRDYGDREEKEIGYYQWVPFVLAIQAIMFYIPNMVWRLLNWQSGISVKGLIGMAQDVKNMEKETRDKNVATVAAHIHDSLDLQRELKTGGRFLGIMFYGKHYGSFVTILYVFIKILYLLNVLGQFLLLNKFLGPQYTFWGFEILRDLAVGREWKESGHFPRVTMCDFDVRVLGNLHRWTVQCVLMINMFNEKIFLFLWWWFMLVAVVTILSAIHWLLISLKGGQSRGFIHRYLRVSDDVFDTPEEKRLLRAFVERELRHDGVFILRMVANNAGDLICTDIMHELWKQFLERQQANTPPPPSLVSASSPDKEKEALGRGQSFRENLNDEEKQPLTAEE